MYNSLALILGHMAGDYLFQSDKMAVNKSGNDLNIKAKRIGYTEITNSGWCTYHCMVYSICVASFVIMDGWRCSYIDLNNCWWSWLVAFVIAYITNYPIDRYSFGWIWMKWFGQTKFSSTYYTNEDGDVVLRNLRALFVPIVYVAIDNTIHLVLMWGAFSLFGGI